MSATPILKDEPLSPLSNYYEGVTECLDDTLFYYSDTLQKTSPQSGSPLSSDLELDDEGDCNDLLLSSSKLDDDFGDIKFEDEDLVSCESRAEVASQILENLESLVNLDSLIKHEEPFFLDEKILPILDPPSTVDMGLIKMEYHHLIKPDTTEYYFTEFQEMYDVSADPPRIPLTPPQSPPNNTNKLLITLEPLVRHHDDAAVVAVEMPATPQPDIARELAVVDELVRSRMEDMQWSTSPPSPNSSSNCSSNYGDCSSSSSSEDPDWIPEPVAEGTIVKGAGRRSAKPYSRPSPQEKKSRKKEQNKNAATRYRMKKKAEVEVILTEEKGLSDLNAGLESQITDMQREIKYLKGLMRDLFKAKGLIS